MAGDKLLIIDSATGWKKQADITAVYTSETSTSKILAPDGSNGVQWVTASGGGVFGDEYFQAEQWGQTSTSQTTYQDRVTLNATSLTNTYYYRLEWMYDTYHGATSVEGRTYNSTGASTVHESSHTETEFTNFHGSRRLTSLSGSVTFKIQWKVTGSGSAYIKYARLVLYRVS